MKRTALARHSALKPGGPIQRVKALVNKNPLRRKKAMPAQGATLAKRPRRRSTGPKTSVCELVDKRSGRICEWPECGQPQADRHHRLNRKAGGRHGEMRERLNGAAWLLGACRPHHDMVTNPVGDVRQLAEDWGWLLREGQDAAQSPVMTCHSVEPVWLDNAGRWHPYEDGVA